MNFTFWYKNEVKAENIEEAIKKEKRMKPKFSSLHQEEDQSERDLTPSIGFQVYQEDEDGNYYKKKYGKANA